MKYVAGEKKKSVKARNMENPYFEFNFEINSK